jgi:hypothetical protein
LFTGVHKCSRAARFSDKIIAGINWHLEFDPMHKINKLTDRDH